MGKALHFPSTPGQPGWGCLLHSGSHMTPNPHKLLSPGYLGCMTALHTSFGREVLLGVSFPPCTPSPLPSPLLFLFTSSQGTRSLRTLIFPVSQYLLNWPLLFSRAFPSLPAQSPSPPGVSMATGEGRKQLMASCDCAGLRGRKRRAGKQESAQQNPPAPRPRIAPSRMGIVAGNAGVSVGQPLGAAAPEPPSRRRRKRRKGGSSCKFPLAAL